MQIPPRIAVLAVALAALAACGERPPRSDPDGAHAYSNETPQNPLYERTREQGRQ
jgi:predicted small lipoprotein YifL